ncbi:MAG: 2-phospho-L-lactate guanylyltransferase [Phototrophicaceae bacterium]
MSVWVLIPVKPLGEAKSRLAEALSGDQRRQLAEHLLRRTLNVVKQIPFITGTLVISRDNYVLALARDFGSRTIQESGAPELNNALMRATLVLQSWRAEAALILPADIPLMNAEDLSEVLKLGQKPRSVVLVTDTQGDGTNVLLSRPPGLFDYAYGVGSFATHQKLAKEAGAAVYIYESERLMLDIDHPVDLERYQGYVAAGTFDAKPLLSENQTGR